MIESIFREEIRCMYDMGVVYVGIICGFIKLVNEHFLKLG